MVTYKSKSSYFLLLFCTELLLSEGFQYSAFRYSNGSTRSSCSLPTTVTTTRLYNNIFGNLFGQQSQSTDESNNNASSRPTASVFEIPTKTIKSKPLRFYLQLFLVSQQNTPVKGSWSLATNEEDTDRFDLYYADGTGLVSFSLDDMFGIRVKRQGKRPSLQYMLQESVLLHNFLDELEQIAFGTGDDDDDTEIDDEKRLLQFSDENNDILSKVRESLSARPVKSP
mmetsp:Transcript_5755/g.6399  ORF Transcript_5755/g.6399 Transcript_5755/m.6399 type:complete len:226 (-) Transcript_5755:262-939(-)